MTVALGLLLNDPFWMECPQTRMNEPFRSAPAPKKAFNSMVIPHVSGQCVHVTQDENYSPLRCLNDSSTSGPNGWLCDDHNAIMNGFKREASKLNVPANRDKDAEIVKSIINYEGRALQGAPRERVRLTIKGLYITYVKDHIPAPRVVVLDGDYDRD